MNKKKRRRLRHILQHRVYGLYLGCHLRKLEADDGLVDKPAGKDLPAHGPPKALFEHQTRQAVPRAHHPPPAKGTSVRKNRGEGERERESLEKRQRLQREPASKGYIPSKKRMNLSVCDPCLQ